MPDGIKEQLNDGQTDVTLCPVLNEQNQIVDVKITTNLNAISVQSILSFSLQKVVQKLSEVKL